MQVRAGIFGAPENGLGRGNGLPCAPNLGHGKVRIPPDQIGAAAGGDAATVGQAQAGRRAFGGGGEGGLRGDAGGDQAADALVQRDARVVALDLPRRRRDRPFLHRHRTHLHCSRNPLLKRREEFPIKQIPPLVRQALVCGLPAARLTAALVIGVDVFWRPFTRGCHCRGWWNPARASAADLWEIPVLGADAGLDRHRVFVCVLLDEACGSLVCEDDREASEIRVRGAAAELGCREEAATPMKDTQMSKILNRHFGDLDQALFWLRREKSMPRRYRWNSHRSESYVEPQALGALGICICIELDVDMGWISGSLGRWRLAYATKENLQHSMSGCIYSHNTHNAFICYYQASFLTRHDRNKHMEAGSPELPTYPSLNQQLLQQQLAHPYRIEANTFFTPHINNLSPFPFRLQATITCHPTPHQRGPQR